jgi:hypothetical protein
MASFPARVRRGIERWGRRRTAAERLIAALANDVDMARYGDTPLAV